MALVKRAKVENYFGQVVIGPPAAGKTTYCAKIHQLYKEKLNRKCEVVNLDPANENMTYKAKVDIMDLVTVEDVMEHKNMGPNGALVYCMEYLESNFDWFLSKLGEIQDSYLIFDMPGQIELYIHNTSIKNIFAKLNDAGYNLCVVHLVDSHYCSVPTKFISTLLLSLSTMLHIALPHVNVLSKADIFKKQAPKLDFNLDFYTEVLDLTHLLEILDEGSFTSQYKNLNAAIVDLVQDYGLVTFILLNVYSDRDLLNIKSAVDKANGYVYGSGEERSIQTLLSCAVGARTATEQFDTDYM